jgi:hypothetical protein
MTRHISNGRTAPITGAAPMIFPLSRMPSRPPVHRIVHRSELAAVHRPSVTVAQHDGGYHTARAETWQASVPGWNVGWQPERPEDVVFEETSVVSTLSQGLEAPGFSSPGFPIPGVWDLNG